MPPRNTESVSDIVLWNSYWIMVYNMHGNGREQCMRNIKDSVSNNVRHSPVDNVMDSVRDSIDG